LITYVLCALLTNILITVVIDKIILDKCFMSTQSGIKI
jgi:hypothetical protein